MLNDHWLDQKKKQKPKVSTTQISSQIDFHRIVRTDWYSENQVSLVECFEMPKKKMLIHNFI